MAKTGTAASLVLAVLALAGCGSSGAAAGATVRIYVAAPLCHGAERALAEAGGEAGELKVRAECLAPVEEGDSTSLATVGANARRATEDSAAVAYLEAPAAAAAASSRPITEAADLAWLQASSGEAAMRRVLGAVREAGTGSVRADVRKSLDS